jgi:hypothetical protein
MDLAATRAQAKRAAHSANREGGQTEAVVAKPLNVRQPPSADGLDRLYHQLVEIHAFVAVQHAECARWHQSDPTSSPIHARTDW